MFYFEGRPETRGVVVHVVFFSWNNNNVAVDSVLFKSCIFMVNMNLDKTILQSNILYFAYSFYLQS